MHLRNLWSQMLQISCRPTGWMCCASHSPRATNCPWQRHGQVMWLITKSWGSNHITGTAEPKVVKFCTQVYAISILATRWHITNKRAWLWSRDCFKILPFVVMQRVARFRQRQLGTCQTSSVSLAAYRRVGLQHGILPTFRSLSTSKSPRGR